MIVEAKNTITENAELTHLEEVASKMTDDQKKEVATNTSVEGRDTAFIEWLVSRFQKNSQDSSTYFDTKNPIFTFEQKQNGWEWLNNWDAGALWSIIESELKNMSTGWMAIKDIASIKVTGVQKMWLWSSQVYLLVEWKDGKKEAWFVNSLPERDATGHTNYLHHWNAYRENGEIDITAAFEQQKQKGVKFEKTANDLFFKYNPENRWQSINVEPYQAYTEVALSRWYKGFSDDLKNKLGIADVADLATGKYRFGEWWKFYVDGKIIKNQEGKDLLTDEEYYICQATKYRLIKGLPAYTGTIDDLKGEYKFKPLYLSS